MNAQSLAIVGRRLDAYARLVRLEKPIGALLLLWPTLWAVWLAAAGAPSAKIVAIFVAGTWLTRSAGCAVNDFADRDFDPHVERTRLRPLAAREIAPGEALAVAVGLGLAALGLALMLNGFALMLSFVGAAIAVAYPFVKRVFGYPQLVLGVAFGFGIPMAYAATLGRLPAECWMLMAANVCYAFAYDTEYAMVDRNDDAKIGIGTSARSLGRHDVAAVMTAYALMLAILVATGAWLSLRWPYYGGLAVAGILMGYHYFLIRDRTREGCFRAFRHNNWVGATIFAGIVLAHLLPAPAP